MTMITITIGARGGRRRSLDGLSFVALEAAAAFEVSNEAGEGIFVLFIAYCYVM
jgi:hypothetical protein